MTYRNKPPSSQLPCYTTSDEAAGKPLPIDNPNRGRFFRPTLWTEQEIEAQRKRQAQLDAALTELFARSEQKAQDAASEE